MKRFALLIALLLIAPQAHAADINAEGAAKLKTIFENIMVYQKGIQKPGTARLEYDGEVMVEPADKYYAVTMPHARLVYPDGAKLDIGMISVNASPHDQPGQWKMALAIPTPIILVDAKQTQALKINIGAQKAAGIWDESLENFAKLDAQYKNITVENPATGFSMQIPETQVLYDFAKGPDGTWSGPGRFLSNAITSTFAGGNAKIDELRGDFSIERYNPSVLKEYRVFLKSFLEEAEQKRAANQKIDPAKTAQLGEMLNNVLLKATNGFGGEYSMSGLEITRTSPVTKAPETLKLAKVGLGLNAKDLMADKVSLGVRLAYNGFNITPVPAGYDGALPSESNFDILFNSVPAKQITEITRNTLQGAAAQPEMAQFAAMSLFLKLPAVLSQANTTVDIKNNFIGNNDYRFDLNGTVKADMAAVNSFTADIKGQFRGLDGLLTKVKAIAGDLNNPAAEKAQGLSRNLEMLKTYGAQQPGTDLYLYDFIVNPQGQMLMNGKPAGFGMMQAAPAQ